MEVIKGILALLGLGGLSLTLVWLLFAVFNLLWAILSAVLATAAAIGRLEQGY